MSSVKKQKNHPKFDPLHRSKAAIYICGKNASKNKYVQKPSKIVSFYNLHGFFKKHATMEKRFYANSPFKRKSRTKKIDPKAPEEVQGNCNIKYQKSKKISDWSGPHDGYWFYPDAKKYAATQEKPWHIMDK